MIETEIKFPVHDFFRCREKLLANNAVRTTSFFEDNVIFDDEEKSLFRQGKLLRLRKSDKVTLTFKKHVDKTRFKIMEEHEVEVSNFESAARIITSLGYKKAFRYQKRREIFTLNDTLVLLDETPIGNFVEIEGEQKAIEKTAQLLELDITKGTSKNYMELYEEHCRRKSIEPADMIF